MPSKDDYRKVADAMRGRLGRKPFLSVTRREITDILREVSGEPTTRIKVLVAHQITEELSRKGLNVYPALADTDSKDMVRIYRAESTIPELIEILNYPSPENDVRLRAALRKVDKDTPSDLELAAAS